MAKVGKDAFGPGYQNRVGYKARKLLHDNSKELVKVLSEHSLVQDGYHFFEIGAGGGRNLWYLFQENSNVKLSCNDLWKEASLSNMHPDIRKVTTFYEGDTEEVLDTYSGEDIDVLLSSDHLMHLLREKGANILNTIVNRIRPSYVVLREVKEEKQTPEEKAKHFAKNYQDYNILNSAYDLIHEQTSHVKDFFIRIYKRK